MVTMDLFKSAGVQVVEPEPTVKVQLGKHHAQVPLRKQRRIAVKRLLELLKEWEGKDIFVGSYDPGWSHFWLDNLKLQHLQPDFFRSGDKDIPGTIWLRGFRGASIRIDTKCLYTLREQEYQGYWLYLLDFWNGFRENPLDKFERARCCLHITRFKD